MDEDRQTNDEMVQEGVVIDSLVEMSKSAISSIYILKGDLKKRKEQLNQKLMENPQYHRAVDNAKEANKLRAEMRKKALQNPEAAKINQEVKDLKYDIKEKQLSLFDYLLEYHNQTKATEIADNAGSVHPIMIEAKIKI